MVFRTVFVLGAEALFELPVHESDRHTVNKKTIKRIVKKRKSPRSYFPSAAEMASRKPSADNRCTFAPLTKIDGVL